MKKLAVLLTALVLACGAASSWAALSGNLVQGGDFETTAFLKNADTYDSLGTPMGPHVWNQDADVGLWLNFWGPPGICGTGSDGVTQH